MNEMKNDPLENINRDLMRPRPALSKKKGSDVAAQRYVVAFNKQQTAVLEQATRMLQDEVGIDLLSRPQAIMAFAMRYMQNRLSIINKEKRAARKSVEPEEAEVR